jgi:hypothetical protein
MVERHPVKFSGLMQFLINMRNSWLHRTGGVDRDLAAFESSILLTTKYRAGFSATHHTLHVGLVTLVCTIEESAMALTKVLLDHVRKQICTSMILDGSIYFDDDFAETINKLLNLCDVQMHYADIIAYVSKKFCVCYASYVDDTQRAGMAAAKEAARLEAMRQLAEKKTAKESAKKEKEADVRAKLEAEEKRVAAEKKAEREAKAAEQRRLS